MALNHYNFITLNRILRIFRFFPFLTLLDVLSTAWAFHFGGHEQNPLPRIFLNLFDIPGILIYGIIVFFLLKYFTNFLIRNSEDAHSDRKLLRCLWIAVIIVYYGVASYWCVIITGNLLILLKNEFLRANIPWVIFMVVILSIVYYTKDEVVPIILSLFT